MNAQVIAGMLVALACGGCEDTGSHAPPSDAVGMKRAEVSESEFLSLAAAYQEKLIDNALALRDEGKLKSHGGPLLPPDDVVAKQFVKAFAKVNQDLLAKNPELAAEFMASVDAAVKRHVQSGGGHTTFNRAFYLRGNGEGQQLPN